MLQVTNVKVVMREQLDIWVAVVADVTDTDDVVGGLCRWSLVLHAMRIANSVIGNTPNRKDIPTMMPT